MANTWVIIGGICFLVAFGLLVGLGFYLTRPKKIVEKPKKDNFEEASLKDVEHIFDDTFREELRNRGRLHFEKIIGENAMFLQQDLRLTTSQLNDFMKDEIKKTLQEEFAKYEESIATAKDTALHSIQKTQEAIEQQRVFLEQRMQEQIDSEKKRVLTKFEVNMADIVNHYVMSSLGSEIDLSDQLEYILSYFEDNKKAILEDITNGA